MARLSAAELGLPDAVACPFCDRRETELHSGFGSQLSVATYWCRQCGTAFEWFKDTGAGEEPPAGPDSHSEHVPDATGTHSPDARK